VTSLPAPPTKKLGLVIDLDTCVGCHACAVACKQWNDIGAFGPLSDEDMRGAEPSGTWFNRVHSYDVLPANGGSAISVHFPRSCLHCENAACVTVCPTGASYKRAEDGIVLVDEAKCIGCKLCAWACPYGAREFDVATRVIKKCTLCVDRIYNEALEAWDRQPACVQACPTRARHFGDLGDPESAVSKLVAERDGQALMPELGYAPVNRYLPPRPRRDGCSTATTRSDDDDDYRSDALPPLLRWLDRALSR
jgi:sulfite dehydrogenase (quinone) subunit SoeB